MKIDSSSKPLSILQQLQQQQTDNLRHMASGKRVESAQDGAAAMQIIERLTAESQAYQRSLGNAYDGISMLGVAEGGLANIQNDMSRIRELTLQAGNGALNDADREALQREAALLTENIYQTVDRTEFAGVPLLSQSDTRTFQLGSTADTSLSIELRDMRQQGLDSLATFDLTDESTNDSILNALDTLTEMVSSQRAEYGAQQQAFESSARNIAQTDIASQESRSRMQDLDYAMGAASNIQNQILQNSAVAVSAQANAQTELALSILR